MILYYVIERGWDFGFVCQSFSKQLVELWADEVRQLYPACRFVVYETEVSEGSYLYDTISPAAFHRARMVAPHGLKMVWNWKRDGF
jgi:hypothetical protein